MHLRMNNYYLTLIYKSVQLSTLQHNTNKLNNNNNNNNNIQHL